MRYRYLNILIDINWIRNLNRDFIRYLNFVRNFNSSFFIDFIRFFNSDFILDFLDLYYWVRNDFFNSFNNWIRLSYLYFICYFNRIWSWN